MYDKFYAYIQKYNMLRGGGIVVAVSGGADSTCLFYLTLELSKRLGIPIYCAHVNHGIRHTAKRDSEFVRKMCEDNGVRFYLKETDVLKLAKERKISEELCGREERYKFFFEVMNKTKSDTVFTAHNLNDSAESVILHLLRGSGAGGLSGIEPVRPDGVCRPLVGFSRTEIEDYLRQRGIPWVEDETNKTDDYTRNFIRHNVFPELEKINPAAKECIVRTGALLGGDDALLYSMADGLGAVATDGTSVSLDCEKLKAAPAPIAKRAVLRALELAKIQPSCAQVGAVMNLLEKQAGKKHVFPCGKTARVTYGRILISTEDDISDYEYDLVIDGEVFIEEIGRTVGVYKEKPEGTFIKISGISAPLKARKRREGDRFMPSGMENFKKVKNFFIDLKIEKSERERTPIITCGNDIVCVGTLRTDNRYTRGDNAVYLQIF